MLAALETDCMISSHSSPPATDFSSRLCPSRCCRPARLHKEHQISSNQQSPTEKHEACLVNIRVAAKARSILQGMG